MSASYKIQLTDQARKIVENMKTLPVRMVAAIAKGMDAGNELAVAKIRRDHLNGIGPFPPEQHKLGVRTSRLRGSVNATPSVISGQTIDSSIGSNVIYAAIHEFGGRIKMGERTQKVRLRTDKDGNLMRQLKNLAIFARKDHKRAKEYFTKVAAHEIEMPERAPFRTGIQESLPQYKRTISAAVVAEWAKLNN